MYFWRDNIVFFLYKKGNSVFLNIFDIYNFINSKLFLPNIKLKILVFFYYFEWYEKSHFIAHLDQCVYKDCNLRLCFIL